MHTVPTLKLKIVGEGLLLHGSGEFLLKPRSEQNQKFFGRVLCSSFFFW